MSTPIKKILILGCPRSGTTALQQQLSHLFNLTNLNEPYYTDHESSIDYYSWTSKKNNCIIKLLVSNTIYNESDFDLIKFLNLAKFDLIVIPNRKDLYNLCISLYYAERIVKQYFYKNKPDVNIPFTCDLEFINGWLSYTYQRFVDSVAALDTHNIPYQILNCEDYLNDIEQEVAGVKFKISQLVNGFTDPTIPYRDLCTNYAEIEPVINDYLKKIQLPLALRN